MFRDDVERILDACGLLYDQYSVNIYFILYIKWIDNYNILLVCSWIWVNIYFPISITKILSI